MVEAARVVPGMFSVTETNIKAFIGNQNCNCTIDDNMMHDKENK